MLPKYISFSLLPLLAHVHAYETNHELYSLHMTESIISRSQGLFNSTTDRSAILQAGFFQKALTQVLSTYPNSSTVELFTSYLTHSINSIVAPVLNATLDTTTFPLDRLSSGNGLMNQFQETSNETYRLAFEALRKSIDLQPRNQEHGLWYWVYPNWSYLDGMYSLAPFLAAYTTAYDTKNASAVHDLTLQLELLYQHCYNASSGLLVHGYDASGTAVWANSLTGASPYVWGRSLGWFTMALIDTLELLPRTAAGDEAREYIRPRFQGLVNAIVAVVDVRTGGWWQILDQPGREGNYIESSATAMFVYSLLKGVRLGLLENGIKLHEEAYETLYTGVAVRAYEYVAENFVVDNGNGTLGWNGTVGVCSLNSTATYDVRIASSVLDNACAKSTSSTTSASQLYTTVFLVLRHSSLHHSSTRNFKLEQGNDDAGKCSGLPLNTI